MSSNQLSEIKGKWKELRKKLGSAEKDIQQEYVQQLIGLLRECIHSGKFTANPVERKTLQWISRDVGDTIFWATQEYPSVIIKPLEVDNSKNVDKIDKSKTIVDLDGAIDIPSFYGRSKELKDLEDKILNQGCRLLTITGLGGIGKSTLAKKLVESISDKFDFVIWRSIGGANFTYILEDILSFFSKYSLPLEEKPIALDKENIQYYLITTLIKIFREKRCLVIFDNMESAMEKAEIPGKYKKQNEGYEVLFRKVGETIHKSCLLITSREEPNGIIRASSSRPIIVNSFPIEGLKECHALEILKELNVSGSEENKKELIKRYSGNPLFLFLASRYIVEKFESNVDSFLMYNNDYLFFGKNGNLIKETLDWHFDRLSKYQKEIIYWLAINIEPISIEKLNIDVIESAQKNIIEILDFIEQKFCIERTSKSKITLPEIVKRYLIEKLVGNILEEIINKNYTNLLNKYSLIQSTVKDYLREEQNIKILGRLIDKLKIAYKNNIDVELKNILKVLQVSHPQTKGYAAGNVINMLVSLDVELNNSDFSNLTIWQANLQGKSLRNVNFCGCDLSKSDFDESFGSALTLAFSPTEKKRLAIGDANGMIHVLQDIDNLQSRAVSETIKTIFDNQNDKIRQVRKVVYSPDGKYLVSGSDDKIIRVWDTVSGKCIERLIGHKSGLWALTISPNGKFIASGGNDKILKIWDFNTKRELTSVENNWIRSLSFSADSKTLASVSDGEKSITIWNIIATEKKLELVCAKKLKHDSKVWSIAYSSDGLWIATGDYSGSLSIWDARTYELKKEFKKHKSAIQFVTFSPNNRKLATSSDDKTVIIWDTDPDIDKWKSHAPLTKHDSRVWSVSFSHDNKILASSSDDQTVRLWNVRTNQHMRLYQGYSSKVLSVAFCSSEKIVASGHEDRKIRIWNIDSNSEEKPSIVLSGHDSWVWSVAFSPNGKLLASGSDDETIKIWNWKSRKCLHTFSKQNEGHHNWIRTIQFSPDGKKLASASDDTNIKIWDIEIGKCLKTFRNHTDWVWSVSFNYDGTLLASGSEDNSVRVWDINTDESRVIGKHDKGVRTVSFSPDGQWLASSGEDGQLKVWNVSTGKCKFTRDQEDEIWSVKFSSDGQHLVLGKANGSVYLYRLDLTNDITEMDSRILIHHSNSVRCVAFNQANDDSNQMVVSGGEDETVRVTTIQGKALSMMRTLKPYEKMDITNTTGLTKAQRDMMKHLGAVEREHPTFSPH